MTSSGDLSLEDSRDALAYWEDRARHLPRRARRARREANAMTLRWRDRVAAAEQDAYGPGLVGAILLFVLEGQMPVRARHAGTRAVRLASRAVVATVVLVATTMLVCAALVVAVTADLVGLI
ncbi:MAG: hypothetical protein JHC95_18420 [Solirubrobacteraceae bacterium]|nr:hypothetical protein [Solirubrobacteraceae bacterium]